MQLICELIVLVLSLITAIYLQIYPDERIASRSIGISKRGLIFHSYLISEDRSPIDRIVLAWGVGGGLIVLNAIAQIANKKYLLRLIAIDLTN